ncbi:MAG: hypothetical protein COZ06_05285 [Armatimonadetes bacterium CG_4_10_14_3_um_filter_66_18]|nr:MAG: hypothetical protein COZ57_20820 [Armatimonadetes bacterium CG_4_8_14_3_um_filter_66_20]PIY51229.1 MAG: hypothetical protein COZ06_05285 [Armatimonadetes bacterium CG_4_10_14_3_um_filter_66_18]
MSERHPTKHVLGEGLLTPPLPGPTGLLESCGSVRHVEGEWRTGVQETEDDLTNRCDSLPEAGTIMASGRPGP